MTLATHAAVGASLAQLVPQSPWLAFVLGFVSHFLLDAIPHWDYKLASATVPGQKSLDNDLVLGRGFIRDLAKICLDLVVGVVVAFGFLAPAGHAPVAAYAAGILGGVLPDFLQFAYFKLKWFTPLVWLQRFHLWIHADWRLDCWPALGIITQALLILLMNWSIIWLIK